MFSLFRPVIENFGVDGPATFDTTTQIICHRMTKGTMNDRVLNAQGTLLDKAQNSTFSFIQTGFLDNGTNGTDCWISLKFLDLCYKKDCFPNTIDILVKLS